MNYPPVRPSGLHGENTDARRGATSHQLPYSVLMPLSNPCESSVRIGIQGASAMIPKLLPSRSIF